MKLTQMPYTGATNILLHSLLRKKYALPKSVIQAVYDWVMNFDTVNDKLPLIWFQTVLTVAQTYGSSPFS